MIINKTYPHKVTELQNMEKRIQASGMKKRNQEMSRGKTIRLILNSITPWWNITQKCLERCECARTWYPLLKIIRSASGHSQTWKKLGNIAPINSFRGQGDKIHPTKRWIKMRNLEIKKPWLSPNLFKCRTNTCGNYIRKNNTNFTK